MSQKLVTGVDFSSLRFNGRRYGSNYLAHFNFWLFQLRYLIQLHELIHTQI